MRLEQDSNGFSIDQHKYVIQSLRNGLRQVKRQRRKGRWIQDGFGDHIRIVGSRANWVHTDVRDKITEEVPQEFWRQRARHLSRKLKSYSESKAFPRWFNSVGREINIRHLDLAPGVDTPRIRRRRKKK
jgi:hypothetical protein